jgi:hypothetical protein
MESAALAGKARTIRDRAWDIARVLDELESNPPADLAERLAQVHALMAKLRGDLQDPELQGWVAFPRKAAAEPFVDYQTLLRSRPVPQLDAAPFASDSFSTAALKAHDAAVAGLLQEWQKTMPRIPRPVQPPHPQNQQQQQLKALRDAISSGTGL